MQRQQTQTSVVFAVNGGRQTGYSSLLRRQTSFLSELTSFLESFSDSLQPLRLLVPYGVPGSGKEKSAHAVQEFMFS